jgi:hypothetical protein
MRHTWFESRCTDWLLPLCVAALLERLVR